jgi:hypothetical protein
MGLTKFGSGTGDGTNTGTNTPPAPVSRWLNAPEADNLANPTFKNSKPASPAKDPDALASPTFTDKKPVKHTLAGDDLAAPTFADVKPAKHTTDPDALAAPAADTKPAHAGAPVTHHKKNPKTRPAP